MGICGFKGKIGNDLQFLIGFNCDSGGEKQAADQMSIHLWFLITASVPVMMRRRDMMIISLNDDFDDSGEFDDLLCRSSSSKPEQGFGFTTIPCPVRRLLP